MTATASRSSQPTFGDINNINLPSDGSIAVIAPCDLEEGYTFMVCTTSNDGLDDDIVPVTVPIGGVHQGQVFYSTSRSFLSTSQFSSNQSMYGNSSPGTIASISSNISEWTPLVQQSSVIDDKTSSHRKDRWYCCRLGFFHVTLRNACCCPQI
jgi:hypothetical protein